MGSKLALLHRVKDRKTPSLSAQTSFALFSLKVAWSEKSLIVTYIRESVAGRLLAMCGRGFTFNRQSAIMPAPDGYTDEWDGPLNDAL